MEVMVAEGPFVSTGFTECVGRWTKFAQFLLLPGTCAVCRQASGRQLDLCAPCERKLLTVTQPCHRCGQPLPPHEASEPCCGACLLKPPPLVRTLAPFRWEEPLSGLVSGFKYSRKLAQGRVLAELLAAHVGRHYTRAELPVALVPVPLHPRKLATRGYNQSLLLARHLGRQLQLPVLHRLVRRVRHTPAQQGLDAATRRRNLRGAFAVNRNVLARLPPGARLALVDDVVTTMSTATALCRCLQAAATTPFDCHLWAVARA